ncbi:MAG: formyltransferase family protein, partial [Ginsengibacter sp.]
MPQSIIDKKFVFAGNRFFVLREMLKAKLNLIKIFAVPGSYLEKELNESKILYSILPDKKSFIEELNNLHFDFFIANGLPHILPIKQLTKDSDKAFINIHPSYLPDLQGKDPVPAAVLFGRDSGATCHYMNDNIDNGDIIQQVKIEYTTELDCALLYQLSFIAERDVFVKSLNTAFLAIRKQDSSDRYINYKIKDSDR